MHILLAAAATLLLGISYSLAVVYQQPEKFWDWLNTLVGSGLSFFLAVLGGIYLFRLQNAITEKSERDDLRELLGAEISDLIRILSDDARLRLVTQSGATKQILIAFVQPLVIEKSAVSSRFNQLESENLLHLARKIRMFNFKSEHMITIIQARADEQFLVHAADNLEETRSATISGLRHVAHQLGISINEHYPDRT
jgi:hypothetical protein